MQRARIIGSATATVKHPTLEGQKLLIAQPLMADGRSPDGDPLVVIDPVGAGQGERVFISSDGRGVREFLGVEATPVRWMVLGIEDPHSGNENG
ncbi:MAG: ethanolamine utilization protein EutN [Pirellulaceae bacterium]|nr:MAG: ethanolamine utilization protein EutN [Pirellulaceae bacterium]